MRVIFAGTPDFAAKHLQALLDDQGTEVVAVYTQPDRPAGRGKKLQASPVKQLAESARIPVRQPRSLKDAASQVELAQWQPDVMVVVAYGLILPPAVLGIPHYGCVNVHASLLPRWRGAAPIQRALAAGDQETGVAIMQMAAGLDSGPVLHTARTDITDTDTSASLYERLAELGPAALLATLKRLPGGKVTPQPQDDEQATYAAKLTKPEGELDWSQPATALERQIRAFNPWPGSFFNLAGTNVKVWAATVIEAQSAAPGTILTADKQHGITIQCGTQALQLTRLQPAGKKPMAADQLLNARADWFQVGSQLNPNR